MGNVYNIPKKNNKNADGNDNNRVDLPIPDILNSDSDNFDGYYKNNNTTTSSNDTLSDSDDQIQKEYNMVYKYIDKFVDKWYIENNNIDRELLKLTDDVSASITPDMEKAIYKKTIFILYSLIEKLFIDIKYNIYGQFFRYSNRKNSENLTHSRQKKHRQITKTKNVKFKHNTTK